ncbi:MAG TPA: hypothetical protein VM864_01985 [Pyrinomonadaceae bacterium]|jgi:hypothetical protein|nr:hypothetical protein [Pyrinomonadaceae bacterium]
MLARNFWLSASSAVLLLSLAASQPPSRAAVGAQGKSRERRGRTRDRAASNSEAPRFEDYLVKEIYRGRIAPVQLKTGRDRMYRTRLREDSRGGPNFAGRYTIVFWGCGTGCAQVTAVDAKTGKVHWLPLDWVDIPDESDAAQNRNFRLSSKLLVLTRSRYDLRASYTAYYYLFDNNGFRLIRQLELDNSEQ